MNLRALSPLRVLVAIGLVSVLGAACGDDSEATLEITGAWARTSPMNVDNGAAYLRLTSPVDDTLLDVSVDAGVAMAAELHETVMSGDGMSGMDGMSMQEVDSIPLPAGETVALEPGGSHIMLLGLTAPL
ncbi:MAG: copper chaperone PCu(A)C, partial [Ilumatobacteraceae bacterium]